MFCAPPAGMIEIVSASLEEELEVLMATLEPVVISLIDLLELDALLDELLA